MSRWMIAVRGFGFLLATPLAMFMTWDFAMTLLYRSTSGHVFEVAWIGCVCALLLLLNAALLSSAATLGAARLFTAHVVLAPPAAFFCYVWSADPVALFFGLPLLAGVIVTLGASSCPIRRRVAAH